MQDGSQVQAQPGHRNKNISIQGTQQARKYHEQVHSDIYVFLNEVATGLLTAKVLCFDDYITRAVIFV